jgi:hypothetical protein
MFGRSGWVNKFYIRTTVPISAATHSRRVVALGFSSYFRNITIIYHHHPHVPLRFLTRGLRGA